MLEHEAEEPPLDLNFFASFAAFSSRTLRFKCFDSHRETRPFNRSSQGKIAN
jgi:hypothetical protein